MIVEASLSKISTPLSFVVELSASKIGTIVAGWTLIYAAYTYRNI